MDRDTIYIFGHKNPDTDSICSAIGYAELKKKLGVKAQACRLGELNEETKFVLDYFKIPVPQKISNVRRQVSDLDLDIVDKLSPDVSIKIAWQIMEQSNNRTLPIVDDAQKLLGLVSITNITDKYMDVFDYTCISSCGTRIDNILETINGEIEAGNRHNFKTSGKIVVAACMPESYGDYIEKGDIVVVGNRGDSQLKALELGANAIIVTCGFKPEEEVIKKADSYGAVVITTPYDTYTTARLINQSIPVSTIMTADENNNIVKFCINDYIEDIRDSMTKNRYRSYPVLDENGVVLGFISRYHLISHRKKKVILLDHNEKVQTVKGIDEAEIMEIIDHHKVGDLTTASPILFKNEPVGSTSTIIANLYTEKGRRPTPSIAGILCAAIISDTLNFKSPTATDYDKNTAQRLADIAGIDIDEFAEMMFKAGTSFNGKSAAEAFSQDFKTVEIQGYTVGISQITVMGMSAIGDMRDGIISHMENIAAGDTYDLLMVIFVDLKEGLTTLRFASGGISEEIKSDLGGNNHEEDFCYNTIMSRKKDVIPLITNIIEKLQS